jgi:tetratricopeptide (TPR) repeat protein
MMRAALLLVVAAMPAQDVVWKTSWKETLKEAKAQNKLAVLLLYNKGVKDCKLYDEKTLASSDVTNALRGFVCARVDPEGPDEDNKLWQDQGSPRLPMTYVFDPEGKQLAEIGTLNPTNYAGVLNGAGSAYFSKIKPAREALAKDPDQPEKWAMLGEAYMKLDSSSESGKNFDKAVDLYLKRGDKPSALRILSAQLDAFYDAKWYAPARNCCKKIQELDPSNETKLGPKAAWVQGMGECKEGKWNDAIAVLRPACDKYKDSDLLAQMMFSLASAYMYNRDKQSALELFETIVKKFPDSDTARISQVQADKLRGGK